MWVEIIVELACSLSKRLSTNKGILGKLLSQTHVPKVSLSSYNKTGKLKFFGLHVSKHI